MIFRLIRRPSLVALQKGAIGEQLMTIPHHFTGSRFCATVLFSLLSTTVIAAQDKGAANGEGVEKKEELSFLDAFTKGKVNATFNYRFEYVDQDGIPQTGVASTLRTTLGYRTGAFKGFSGYLEFEDVSDIGAKYQHNNKGFRSAWNGVTTPPRAVVADPAGTNIQQAYLDYDYGKSRARLGAQEIVLDDHRFIGNVGWRQHHQSFDAVLLTTEEVENATFYAAYVNKVKTITRASIDTDTFILNGHYKFKDLGQLTVYDYYIDITTGPSLISTNTIGIEFRGQREANKDWGYRYEAEFASQSDVSDNPMSISAVYYHLMAGGIYKKIGLRVGYEVLGSDGGNVAFQTPLATLHKFNGWADQFLSTPATGLQDLYIKLDGPLGPTKWALIYHTFTADNGGADYGTEFDGVITYKAKWGETFGLKFAFYSADQFKTDKTVAWLWTGFKF